MMTKQGSHAQDCGLDRQREHPRRPFNIWSLDVSKQVVSTAAAHFAGIFIAIWLASHAVSQCAWYFVAFSVDTTLGVCITVSLHKLALRKAQQACAANTRSSADSWATSIAECGDYGESSSSLEAGQDLLHSPQGLLEMHGALQLRGTQVGPRPSPVV